MHRPDDRPLRKLPTLTGSKDALEKCVFCPKLCRSACPVSNVEQRETLTPWGKMSMSYFLAREDVPMEPSYAAPAWACTGCYGCREACDHRNDVATTLLQARAGLVEQGVAPAGATRTIERFGAHQDATRKGVRELCAHAAVRSDSRDTMLLGCSYVRGATREATHAIDAATALLRGPVALAEACCGLPLLLAGDAKGFARQAEIFARETARAERILVVDPGCAVALRTRYPEVGVKLHAKVELVVELAAKELDALTPVKDAPPRVRYHDPCQLGRGLGIYEAPRAVLTRALGRAPDEFDTRREKGTCSGAGGLLPATMPEVAKGIADMRLDEHARAGGGRVVTACASSLISFRKRTREPVDDLMTWVARAARPWRPTT